MSARTIPTFSGAGWGREGRWLRISGMAAACLIAAAGPAAGHGTRGAVVQKRTVCAAFAYDDDEPMGYAKVEIRAPETETPFQSGATDRNGVVCFAPDRSGSWRLSANDGMGHAQSLSVTVEEPTATPPPATQAGAPANPEGQTAPATAQPANRLDRILAGVGIILGLAGAVSLYRSRRSGRRSPTAGPG